jgi:3-oxoacyl-[acyl-carrier protein] reductase
MSGRASITEMTEEYYTQMMDSNFKSCVFLSKAVLPSMVEKGTGNIVNISSLAAHSGGGLGIAIYAAAKGIRVNAIAPGVIANTSNDRFKTDEIRKSIIASIPLHREGLPEDVANSVLFLVSDLSAFISGETLEVNGGMFMR